MSTRAMLAVPFTENGVTKFKAIYSHSDGYPEYTQRVLNHFYTDEVKVNKLINQGYMSVLGAEVGTKQDFRYRGERVEIDTCDYRIPEQCIFYHRDRGDELDVTVVGSRDELHDVADGMWCEYVYIFDGDKWQLSG